MLTTIQIRVAYSHRVGSYTGVTIWSTIELFMAVICACLPTLRPVGHYSLSKLTILISSAISSSRLGNSAREPESKDSFVLASKDTAGVFQRLPDRHFDTPLPLNPVQARVGHVETA